MKPFLAIFICGLIGLALLAGFFMLKNSAFVIGGEYTLTRGQVVEGDVNALFARVTVAEGAHVRGNLTSISSDLDIRGVVDGDVLLVQSEAQLRDSCKMSGAQHRLDVFNYIFLLPEVMRAGPAAG